MPIDQPPRLADDHHADLAAATTAWTDQWWDDEVGLLWMPVDPVDGGYPQPAFHMLPQTAWYAVGLLLRGDDDRAVRALSTVLDHQYDEPGNVWHGTYTLVHEIAHPQPGARMWDDYDPNWRQFISCTLLLLLRNLGERLPASLTDRIDTALRLAVEGEHAEAGGRRITTSYSNISLMQAYVEVEAGRRLDEREWIAGGEDRARRTVARFDRHGAFDEFNSPTYHGIDLKALGLWRGHSDSDLLHDLGTRVEAELWSEAARWYHAGLRQVAGPYTRAYGMDLGRYVAQWAVWIWAAAGREIAPLPDLGRPLEHSWDLSFGPAAALIGAAVPDDARRDLLELTGERVVTRRISEPDDGDRVATAWLADDVAFGAESSTVDLSWWEQFHAATAHWRRADGSIGWLRAIVPGPSDATVEPGRMVLRWHHGADPAPDAVARFELEAPLTDADPVTLTSDGAPLPAGVAPIEARPGPGPVTTFELRRG
ncbi:MAG: hypothetical protein JO291_09385 [Acidimicrobiia bacterium]|nr:hypothetical protein [Acidimicrobiia bacterium]